MMVPGCLRAVREDPHPWAEPESQTQGAGAPTHFRGKSDTPGARVPSSPGVGPALRAVGSPDPEALAAEWDKGGRCQQMLSRPGAWKRGGFGSGQARVSHGGMRRVVRSVVCCVPVQCGVHAMHMMMRTGIPGPHDPQMTEMDSFGLKRGPLVLGQRTFTRSRL